MALRVIYKHTVIDAEEYMYLISGETWNSRKRISPIRGYKTICIGYSLLRGKKRSPSIDELSILETEIDLSKPDDWRYEVPIPDTDEWWS